MYKRQATTGKIATVIGRYYAMDRDKRWERVKVAYDALVSGIGERSSDMVEAVQKSYDEGVTDEFIKPFVRIDENGQPVGMIPVSYTHLDVYKRQILRSRSRSRSAGSAMP